LIRRNDEYSRLFEAIAELSQSRGLPERSNLSIFDAALGFKVTNSRYRVDAEVTELTASRDLKRLSEAELIIPVGEKRGRTYRAADVLKEIRQKTRLPRPLENPYDLIARRQRRAATQSEPRLPGL
jgi:DNA-binding transcriptional ArsR family regulator